MRITPFLRAATLLAAASVICTSCADSTAPLTKRSLAITVTPPPGAPAAITVTGPHGYQRTVNGTTTLANLSPGSYTISASNVRVSNSIYSPTPALDTVAITAVGPDTTARASVAYALASGGLAITVSGLPAAAPAYSIIVAGPSGISHSVTATDTLWALAPGTYTITASNVVLWGEGYVPTPAFDTVTVAASTIPAAAGVAYALAPGVMTITVRAPPGVSGAITVSGVTSGLQRTLTATTTLTGLFLDTYSITAASVTVGGVLYIPNPSSLSLTPDGSHVATGAFDYRDPYFSYWSTETWLPWVRSHLAAATIGGKVYVVGVGLLGEFDPATGVWTAKSPMPLSSGVMTAAAIGGILYAISDSGTLAVYDPATDQWSSRSSMPTRRSASAAAEINGVLYVAGGYTSNTLARSNVLEAYDPATDSWTTKASMPTARSNLAVAVLDGILYAMGGRSDSMESTDAVEAYDPATNQWTVRASIIGRREEFAADTIGGKIYAVGGNFYSLRSGTDLTLQFGTTESYDPINNRWTGERNMPTPRYGLAACAVDGALHAIGGAARLTTSLLQPPVVTLSRRVDAFHP